MLTNVYLHSVLDLWSEKMAWPPLRRGVKVVRFAAGWLPLFGDERDDKSAAAVLLKPLAKFGLEVAPEKTGLVPSDAKTWR